jgi:hypothetical protein
MRLDELKWEPHGAIWDRACVSDTIRVYRPNKKWVLEPFRPALYDIHLGVLEDYNQEPHLPEWVRLDELTTVAILYHLLGTNVTNELPCEVILNDTITVSKSE